MDGKVGIFIDAGYFDKVCLELGFNADFGKLSDKIGSLLNSEIYRTYYYDCLPYQGSPPTKKEREMVSKKQRFFYSLNLFPHFEVRLGKLVKSHKPSKRFEQKGIDVLLSIDLIELVSRGNISKVALISGDSDFVPAIERAKTLGAQTYVLYAKTRKTGIHHELFKVCDDRIQIDSSFLKSVER